MQKQTIKLSVLVEVHTQTTCDLAFLSSHVKNIITSSDPSIESVSISECKLLPRLKSEAIVTTDDQGRDVVVFPKEYAGMFFEYFASNQTQDMISVNIVNGDHYSVNIDTESAEELEKIADYLNSNE
jgi:hypothetical protein